MQCMKALQREKQLNFDKDNGAFFNTEDIDYVRGLGYGRKCDKKILKGKSGVLVKARFLLRSTA